MKKHYYLYAVIIIALVAVIPFVTRAENGQTGTSAVKDLLRAKNANIQNNESIRNKTLESGKLGSTTLLRPGTFGDIRALASSTRPLRQGIKDERKAEVKDIRQQGREDMKNASSSEERHEIRKNMRKDEFKVRKDAIIKQLNVTLNNLKQIRARISSRIDKAVSEGRDMTKAKSLLVIADAKIVLAEQAINAVAIFNPTATSTVTASSTTATSTPVIDLGKPREVGNTAIKALKQAHTALVAVVVAIARSMGFGNASTTPPILPPPPSATTTATTTTTI